MTALAGRRLLILTEGDTRRGLGHIMRCSAYGEVWAQAGGEVAWIIDGDLAARAALPPEAEARLAHWRGGAPGIDQADAVLIDAYDVDAATRERLIEGAVLPVFIDDAGQDTYPRGVVINAGLEAAAPPGARAEWLCGPGWQALRAPFRQLTPRAPTGDVERVLILMGGTDPRGLAGRMARLAGRAFPGAWIDQIGGANGEANDRIHIHGPQDADGMAGLMQAADIAISAAGQSIAELARCGVASVMIQVANNQVPNLAAWPVAAGFVAAGAWDDAGLDARIEAGLAALAPLDRRQDVFDRATRLIDGQGAERVIAHLAARLNARET